MLNKELSYINKYIWTVALGSDIIKKLTHYILIKNSQGITRTGNIAHILIFFKDVKNHAILIKMHFDFWVNLIHVRLETLFLGFSA